MGTEDRVAGFTLIELMIVIAIIGILAAIAIPQFDSYKKRAYNASAQWDVKNAAVVQEAYYVDHLRYADNVAALKSYGLNTTEGVVLTVSGGTNSYSMTAYHPKGDKTYVFNGSGGVE